MGSGPDHQLGQFVGHLLLAGHLEDDVAGGSVQGFREIGVSVDLVGPGGFHGWGLQVGVDHEGHIGDLAEVEELQQAQARPSASDDPDRVILGSIPVAHS